MALLSTKGRPGLEHDARPENFEIIGTVPVVLGDDVEVAADKPPPVVRQLIGSTWPKSIRSVRPAWVRKGRRQGK